MRSQSPRVSRIPKWSTAANNTKSRPRPPHSIPSNKCPLIWGIQHAQYPWPIYAHAHTTHPTWYYNILPNYLYIMYLYLVSSVNQQKYFSKCLNIHCNSSEYFRIWMSSISTKYPQNIQKYPQKYPGLRRCIYLCFGCTLFIYLSADPTKNFCRFVLT